jgi:tRNA A37 threonylcarbamoyladenosine synthetase subunit TsaC/SUA5/YrdC
VSDLAARPELFARLSGDEVPQDVLESMKNPLASPSAWRKKSPQQVQHLAPMKV